MAGHTQAHATRQIFAIPSGPSSISPFRCSGPFSHRRLSSGQGWACSPQSTIAVWQHAALSHYPSGSSWQEMVIGRRRDPTKRVRNKRPVDVREALNGFMGVLSTGFQLPVAPIRKDLLRAPRLAGELRHLPLTAGRSTVCITPHYALCREQANPEAN